MLVYTLESEQRCTCFRLSVKISLKYKSYSLSQPVSRWSAENSSDIRADYWSGERATVLLMRINVKITRSIKTGGRLEMIKTFRRLCNTCERSRRLTDQLIEMFRANYQLTADLPADRSLRRVLPGHGTVLASRGRGYYNNARYYVYLTAAGPVIIFKWRR